MKDIKNYEGLYAITKDGQIWSYPNSSRNPSGMWLKPTKYKTKRIVVKDYRTLRVCLWKNKQMRSFSIHRLVAGTYIPNPENKLQVNHKDGNSLNNHVDNLEWVTGSENMQHASGNGLLVQYTEKQCKNRSEMGKKYWKCTVKARRKFNMAEAKMIKDIYNITHRSFAAISRAYNVSAKTIENICKNKTYQFEI